MTSLLPRRRGKPRREEMELPANIQRAFIARASGANWIQCAEVAETSTENLRKWRNHPDAQNYIQTAIESNLGESHSKFADAAPKLAERLIELGLSKDVRAYAQITAISECFKIMQQGIVDKQNQEEMARIREALDQLEGNRAPDVIDVESNG